MLNYHASPDKEEHCTEDPYIRGPVYSLWAVPIHSLPCNDSLFLLSPKGLVKAGQRGGGGVGGMQLQALKQC